MLVKNVGPKKTSWSQIFFDPKLFYSNFFDENNFWSTKMCLSKKFGVKNNLGKKIFMVEKFLSPKILVEQNFESKETLDPKRFLVQKDSGPKKI